MGLLEEELSEQMLSRRVRDKRFWDFWLGEYRRRVDEAGGEDQFIKWMVFNQNMLRKSGKKWEERWVWEARERLHGMQPRRLHTVLSSVIHVVLGPTVELFVPSAAGGNLCRG